MKTAYPPQILKKQRKVSFVEQCVSLDFNPPCLTSVAATQQKGKNIQDEVPLLPTQARPRSMLPIQEYVHQSAPTSHEPTSGFRLAPCQAEFLVEKGKSSRQHQHPSTSMQDNDHALQCFRLRTQGKCFNCLARDHRAINCRDPPRCFLCLCSGHRARHCKRGLHPPAPQPPQPSTSEEPPSSQHPHRQTTP